MSNTNFSNPYDFGSPISDKENFADRTEELEKIEEYLDLSAGNNPSYYHLAFTGSRAAGKTSLVNLTKQLADDRGFLPVKVPLNEDLVRSDVEFFTRLIDEIMTVGVEKGMYDGVGSKTHRKFRQVIDTLDLEVQFDLPFSFGSAYIGAQTNEGSSRITQRVLINDFEELHNEAKDNGMSTIVILLDECDLLSTNKALLQKIRNIFTEMDGYILVLSGTEKMFPDLSDTFSPLPRSFVTINVENFDNREDTQECIQKPLPEEEKDLINPQTIDDIHRITGGSPYEINLISHHMYRRFKKEEDDEISLSKQVLDDVLKEVERLRKEGHHEIADQIKRLSVVDLKVLISSIEFPNAPREWLLEYSLLNNFEEINERNRSQILGRNRDIIERLLSDKILSAENNRVQFAGGQFDSLYLRYYVASMEQFSSYNFFKGQSEEYLANIQNKIINLLSKDINGWVHFTSIYESIHPTEDGETIRKEHRDELSATMTISTATKNSNPTTRIGTSPESISRRSLISLKESVHFRLNVNWLDEDILMVGHTVGGGDNVIEKIEETVSEVEAKLKTINYSFQSRDEIDLMVDGVAEANAGNREAALNKLNKALEINPKFDRAKLEKAKVIYQSGSVEEAITLLEDLGNGENPWEEARVEQGLIYLEEEEVERGFELINQSWQGLANLALRDDDNFWQIFIGRLSEIGFEEKADEYIQRLVDHQFKYDNSTSEIYGELRKVPTLHKLERDEAAKNILDKLETESTHLKYQISKSYLEIGDVESAVPLMDEVLSEDDRFTENYKNSDVWNLIQVDERLQSLIESHSE